MQLNAKNQESMGKERSTMGKFETLGTNMDERTGRNTNQSESVWLSEISAGNLFPVRNSRSKLHDPRTGLWTDYQCPKITK